MVQYRNKDVENRNHYWKLTWRACEYRSLIHRGLNNLGFAFNTSTGGHRLSYLVSRAMRGLTSYEKCTLKEVKAFRTAKDIQGVNHASRKKSEYVAALEHADDDGASFPRFLDLPPELRVRIYGHYMDSLDSMSRYEVQGHREAEDIKHSDILSPPPITQVCATLRKETMPMFFDIFRFQFRSRRPGDSTLASPLATLTKAPSHLVDQVKQVAIRCPMVFEHPGLPLLFRTVSFEVHIDLARANRPLSIVKPKTLVEWIDMDESPGWARAYDEAKSHFSELLDARVENKDAISTLTDEFLTIVTEISKVVEGEPRNKD